MKTTFIKSVQMLQTGGYIMNEVITLEDDSVIVICEDAIFFYKNIVDYETGENHISCIER
jgi:hypothetical protein